MAAWGDGVGLKLVSEPLELQAEPSGDSAYDSGAVPSK